MSHQKTSRPWILLLLLVCLPGLVLGQVTSASNSAAIDELFEPWNREDSPGAAVIVVRGGEVLFRQCYGSAHLEHGIPITPETIFNLASISKHFTAYAVTRLEEQGKLSLDDEIYRYIPELPRYNTKTTDTEITLRQLIHHTSGLRDQDNLMLFGGWRYDDVKTTDHVFQMILRQRSLNFEPGEKYGYSSSGYVLLAEVVQRVTGLTLRDWFHENVFVPLGMNVTHFPKSHQEIVKHRAATYEAVGEISGGTLGELQSSTHRDSVVGSTGLRTSADDLGIWMRHLLSQRLKEPKFFQRMTERGVLNNGDTIPYGRGLRLGQHRGLEMVWHGGAVPGTRNAMLLFPQQDFGVAVLSNRNFFSSKQKALAIAELFLGDAMTDAEETGTQETGTQETGSQKPWQPDETTLAEYAGRYYSAELEVTHEIALDNGALFDRHRRLPELRLEPTTPGTFESWEGWHHFTRDATGRVDAMVLSTNRNEAIRFERIREGIMNKTVLTAQLYIEADYDDVWQRFTDASLYADWYSSPCREFGAAPGAAVVWGNDERIFYQGELVRLEKGKGLAHTFQFVGFGFDEPPTLVEIDIVQHGPVVLVTVRHETAGAPRTRDMITEVGWLKSLSRLKTLLEAGRTMPWPS